METIDKAYHALLWGSLIFLSLLLFSCFIRAILGPRFTDRVVAINVICTKTIIIIAVLSSLLSNSSLLDIAIVYAMIAFLVVVVLSKCYIMPHHTKPANLASEDGKHAGKNEKENSQ